MDSPRSSHRAARRRTSSAQPVSSRRPQRRQPPGGRTIDPLEHNLAGLRVDPLDREPVRTLRGDRRARVVTKPHHRPVPERPRPAGRSYAKPRCAVGVDGFTLGLERPQPAASPRRLRGIHLHCPFFAAPSDRHECRTARSACPSETTWRSRRATRSSKAVELCQLEPQATRARRPDQTARARNAFDEQAPACPPASEALSIAWSGRTRRPAASW